MPEETPGQRMVREMRERHARQRGNGCCGRPSACRDFGKCAHRDAHEAAQERERLGIVETPGQQLVRETRERHARQRDRGLSR